MAQNPMSDREYSTVKRAVRVMAKLQTPIYRLRGGREWGKLSGRRVCLLTMTGAKSGKQRTIPLMYVPWGKEDEGAVVVASLGGAPKHPVWYYNLVANTDVEVQVGSRVLKLRARRVEGEERDAVWATCVEHYPPFAEYKERTDREIPVFVCEPRDN